MLIHNGNELEEAAKNDSARIIDLVKFLLTHQDGDRFIQTRAVYSVRIRDARVGIFGDHGMQYLIYEITNQLTSRSSDTGQPVQISKLYGYKPMDHFNNCL